MKILKQVFYQKKLKLRKLRSRATGLGFDFQKFKDKANNNGFVLECSNKLVMD